MSAAPKQPHDFLRPLDLDQLLSRRFHEEHVENRRRRIARIAQLWDHRKFLGKVAAWGAAISLLIAFLIPSRYASTIRLMPPDPPAGQGMAMLAGILGKMGPGFSTLGGDLLGMKTSADLFAGVLESRTVQDDLISKYHLRDVYGEARWVDARKELSRRTDISIDRKSGILTVEVTDHDPKRASALAQEYIAQLNGVVTLLNTSSAHRERVFLEDRLNQVKDELGIAEKDFSQFASRSGAIDIKEQGKAMVEAAALLEGQYIAAQTELEGLRTIYTDQNVRVRTAQARVNELRRQMLKIGGKPELDTATAATPRAEEAMYPSIRKLPLLGVTYADLYRRMKVQETVFEMLTQQYEIAKVQEAKEVPSVKVLDPPDIPEKKTFPPRILLTVLGGLLALVIGIGWIVGHDHWSKIDPEDPGKILVLNMVESVRPQIEYVAARRNSLADHAKKNFDRFRTQSAPLETKQQGTD